MASQSLGCRISKRFGKLRKICERFRDLPVDPSVDKQKGVSCHLAMSRYCYRQSDKCLKMSPQFPSGTEQARLCSGDGKPGNFCYLFYRTLVPSLNLHDGTQAGLQASDRPLHMRRQFMVKYLCPSVSPQIPKPAGITHRELLHRNIVSRAVSTKNHQ